MIVRLVAQKLAGAHFAESDARTVVGVDVGSNFEDEACELRIIWFHHPFLGLGGLWTGRNLHKAIEQLLHTEVVESRTEEHRSDLCLAVVVNIELRIDTIDELEVIAQPFGKVLSDMLLQVGRLHVYLHLLGLALLVGGEEVEVVLIDVVHAFKFHTLSDRPRQGSHMDVQFLLQLIEQVEGVTAFTVHLVDKDDDGCVAHAAHLHELTGLSLHAFG